LEWRPGAALSRGLSRRENESGAENESVAENTFASRKRFRVAENESGAGPPHSKELLLFSKPRLFG